MLTSVAGWRPVRAGFVACVLAFPCVAQTGPEPTKLDSGQMTAIRGYISSAWDTLTRSMTDCKTVVDPKLPEASVLYLPAEFSAPPAVQKLQQDCKVQVKNLPMVIHGPGEVDTNTFAPHGLLYLEHPYVVPGGRFNEMYGWDRRVFRAITTSAMDPLLRASRMKVGSIARLWRIWLRIRSLPRST